MRMLILSYTVKQTLPNVCTKFQSLAVVPQKSLTKCIREKKWTNKRNDKYMFADSVLHDTNSHIECLYQI